MDDQPESTQMTPEEEAEIQGLCQAVLHAIATWSRTTSVLILVLDNECGIRIALNGVTREGAPPEELPAIANRLLLDAPGRIQDWVRRLRTEQTDAAARREKAN